MTGRPGHSVRVRPALAQLPEVDPAIAALALWCLFRDGESPTHTAGDIISIGPEFPLLPISEQTGVVAHHVLHVALRHSSRKSASALRYANGFDGQLFDLACDALVNETLLQGGHALPRPAVRAAELVAMLPEAERPDNVLSDWDSDRLYAAMAKDGAAAQGKEGAFRQYARSKGFEPDLKGADPSQGDADLWAGRVSEALREGHRAGGGIGAVLQRFGDLPRSITPWEIRLRRMLAKAVAHHPRPSHRRPSRAWLALDALARTDGSTQPIFEPGTAREGMRPRLVIGLDTSSSIPEASLTLFASEIMGIVRRSGAEVHILGFDTEVHTRGRLEHAELVRTIQMRRGGGTSFDKILSEATALDPSLIIMFTDLDAPLERSPQVPVIWAVAEKPAISPSYGEILVLGDELPLPELVVS